MKCKCGNEFIGNFCPQCGTPAAASINTETDVTANNNTADANPVNETPVNADPVNATPVNETPVNANPVNATPVYTTPVNANPVNANPVNANPVNATAVYANPVNANPVNATPVNATPVNATPLYANSVNATIYEFLQALYNNTTPLYANSVNETPVNATPVNETPVNATPVNPPPANPNLVNMYNQAVVNNTANNSDQSTTSHINNLFSKLSSATKNIWYKNPLIWAAAVIVAVVCITIFSNIFIVSEEDFKDSCIKVTYSDLNRNPDKYKGTNCEFSGYVYQVDESDDKFTMVLIDVGSSEYDLIYTEVKNTKDSSRILEGDYIRFWGTCAGTVTYTNTLGTNSTQPAVYMEYYEIS